MLITPIFIFSQQTASDFFKTISENYASFEGYTANFKFTSGVHGNIVQEGLISYKSPNLLRLDYTDPDGQVLNVNSRKLSLYIPAHGTLFEQEINSEAAATALQTSGLTSQGLTLFISNYTISYVTGPELEMLDETYPEEVYKLKFTPRKYSEPFIRITMSITSDGFIRRLESITRAGETVIMDIVDIDTSASIPDTLFDYDAPPTATSLVDFLFTPGDGEE